MHFRLVQGSRHDLHAFDIGLCRRRPRLPFSSNACQGNSIPQIIGQPIIAGLAQIPCRKAIGRRGSANCTGLDLHPASWRQNPATSVSDRLECVRKPPSPAENDVLCSLSVHYQIK